LDDIQETIFALALVGKREVEELLQLLGRVVLDEDRSRSAAGLL